jgi:WD40 repeat protein
MRCFVFIACFLAVTGCGGGSSSQGQAAAQAGGASAGIQPSTHKMPTPGIGISGAAFSPDGKLVCVTCACQEKLPSWHKAVRVWNVATGLEVSGFGEDSVFAPAFLADGKRIILKPRESAIQIREARTDKLLGTLQGTTGNEYLSGLTPDRNLALVQTGSLIDVRSQKVLGQLDQGTRPRDIGEASFTPDGKVVNARLPALVGQDYEFGVWQLTSGKLVRYARWDDHELYPDAFSPDGRLAISEVWEDRQEHIWVRLVLWDVPSGAEVRWLKRNAEAPAQGTPFSYHRLLRAGFSSDGLRVTAILGDSTLRSWEVATGTEVWSTRVHYPAACAFSPDGRYAVTASGSQFPEIAARMHRIQLWDTTCGRFLHALSGPNPPPPAAGSSK